jgi:hypothetical protein
VFGAIGGFVVSYLREKGKNAATKEDIAEISSKVESVRGSLAEPLERLKADLLARSHYGKVRYEREMKVYEDIWPAVSHLRDAVLWLRPVIAVGTKDEADEQKKREEKLDSFAAAQKQFFEAFERSKPFYPQVVWSEIASLNSLCWDKAFAYKYGPEKKDLTEHWEQAQKNSEAIRAQIDKICEAIRTRLAKFDEI